MDSCSGDEVFDGAGDEDFVWAGQSADSCGDVYSDSAEVVAASLTFPGVQPGPHVDSESRWGSIDDVPRRNEHRGQVHRRTPGSHLPWS